jgi:hypothetical protein
MEHIPTTATAVQNLKLVAKQRRKATGESLTAAREAVARDAGYANWKQVTVCRAATVGTLAAKLVLPVAVQTFLAEQRAARTSSPGVLEALRSGLLFAMDVKDAESVNPEARGAIEECEDARVFLAGDIWQAILQHDAEEGDAGSARLEADDEGVLQAFFDEVANYRFFRYLGASTPKSLDEAFSTVFQDFFFPPTHVWLAGKFIDMAEVSQVQVDSKVVYSSSMAGPVKDSPAPHAGHPSQAPKGTNAVSFVPGRPFVAKLDVRKWEPGMYEYIVHEGSHELYTDAGFNSISEALKAASDTEGDIIGFEVSYAGYVVGTYPLGELHATAEAVAQRAVETAASMRRAE